MSKNARALERKDVARKSAPNPARLPYHAGLLARGGRAIAAIFLAGSLFWLSSPAQATLIGVSFRGFRSSTFYELHPATLSANATTQFPVPLGRVHALAQRSNGHIFGIGRQEVGVDAFGDAIVWDVLTRIDPITGETNDTVRLLNAGGGFTGLAFSPDDLLFGVQAFPAQTSKLWRIDRSTGEQTLVGGTGASSFIQGLAFSRDGRLYGWNVQSGLVEVDPLTGASTRITQGPEPVPLIQSLLFLPDGRLIGAGTDLFDIDVVTGIATSRGAWVSDSPQPGLSITGLALPVPEPSAFLLVAYGLAALTWRSQHVRRGTRPRSPRDARGGGVARGRGSMA